MYSANVRKLMSPSTLGWIVGAAAAGALVGALLPPLEELPQPARADGRRVIRQVRLHLGGTSCGSPGATRTASQSYRRLTR